MEGRKKKNHSTTPLLYQNPAFTGNRAPSRFSNFKPTYFLFFSISPFLFSFLLLISERMLTYNLLTSSAVMCMHLKPKVDPQSFHIFEALSQSYVEIHSIINSFHLFPRTIKSRFTFRFGFLDFSPGILTLECYFFSEILC